MKRKKLYYVFFALGAVGAAATIIFAYMLVLESIDNNRGRDYYAALSAIASESQNQNHHSGADSAGGPKTVLHDDPEDPRDNADAAADGGETYFDNGDGYRDDIPDNAPTFAPSRDFVLLKRFYPGIVAWITLDQTVVDYPVMQGVDNEYYLTHLPDGVSHKMGSIFLDYASAADFSDKNTIIYGHHMKSGDMFAVLELYKKQDFLEEHPVILINTPFNDFKLEIFAGYVVDGETPVLERKFKNDEAFLDYINRIRRLSYVKSGVNVNAEDKIVSLITCTYNFTNARFVVVGKLADASR
ncbi:MAG: class B sortase [Defluviitaleaceae bacterium]|nr:class B sortase [Defluviitaleaceae bacterium]